MCENIHANKPMRNKNKTYCSAIQNHIFFPSTIAESLVFVIWFCFELHVTVHAHKSAHQIHIFIPIKMRAFGCDSIVNMDRVTILHMPVIEVMP